MDMGKDGEKAQENGKPMIGGEKGYLFVKFQ